jgi:hypothetical protein
LLISVPVPAQVRTKSSLADTRSTLLFSENHLSIILSQSHRFAGILYHLRSSHWSTLSNIRRDVGARKHRTVSRTLSCSYGRK